MVGNIMIDSFEMLREKIASAGARDELGLDERAYAVVTLHRPSNVDELETMAPIVDSLINVSRQLPVVFVAHPRTVKALRGFKLIERLEAMENLLLIEPVPYAKFMNLVTGARVVITDSGGLQEETSYLDIPCLTMRENTERPVTIELGTNALVNTLNLSNNLDSVLNGNWKAGAEIPLWDGNTAQRVVESLHRRIFS